MTLLARKGNFTKTPQHPVEDLGPSFLLRYIFDPSRTEYQAGKPDATLPVHANRKRADEVGDYMTELEEWLWVDDWDEQVRKLMRDALPGGHPAATFESWTNSYGVFHQPQRSSAELKDRLKELFARRPRGPTARATDEDSMISPDPASSSAKSTRDRVVEAKTGDTPEADKAKDSATHPEGSS